MLNRYIFIILFLFADSIHAQNDAEYIIFTISEYQNAANIISKLHSIDTEDQYKLSTDIVFLDNFEWYDTDNPSLNIYIKQEVQNLDDNVKYLLLLGDEISIPPIYITAADGSLQPSDDFYSSIDTITTFTNLENSVPQISTGRIPINNSEQANVVAEKLYEYMINPTFGIWRSKIGLIADDENKDGYSRNELNHTINTNNIYQSISNNLHVSQFYGLNYDSIENGNYTTKPQMTSDIIDYINQGAGLINYIGHGSENTLGGEKIIDMNRDLNHICGLGSSCQEQKKPAIWVAGTCSFGKYDNTEQIMSEKLLFGEVGAISLITTSRGIGAYANSIYLTNLFNNINEFIIGNNNHRLGDIVKESKRIGKNTEYLFHLLGDPALILPFPKLLTDNSMVNENSLLENGLEIMKNINSDLYNFGLNSNDYENINIAIKSNEVEYEDNYPDTTITYTLTGKQVHAGIISENSCINIPLDIEDCTDCSTVDITLFSDKSNNNTAYNGTIQTIKNIPVYLNEQFQNDNSGPMISLYQSGIKIDEGSILNINLPVEINLEDPQGINFMDEIQHNVRYWFNNDINTLNLNTNLFEYDAESCGKTSAIFYLPSDLMAGYNTINIEAWDNGNNRSLLTYSFIIENKSDQYVSRLYNFPNPFTENTFFTFYLIKYPAEIEISIYTPHGNQIKTINATCNDYYNVLEWDGKTNSGEKLRAGPYIYSFKSNAIINGVNYRYETINKIAKLK